MNDRLQFRFDAFPPALEVQQQKFRRQWGYIALTCLAAWLLCLFLRSPQWTSELWKQGGLTFGMMWFARSITASRKERARWGSVVLKARELVVNDLDTPKKKIPLDCIQSWKIRSNYLVIHWVKPRKSWFRKRKTAFPFKELEKPEEFLAEFVKHVAAAKNQTASL